MVGVERVDEIPILRNPHYHYHISISLMRFPGPSNIQPMLPHDVQNRKTSRRFWATWKTMAMKFYRISFIFIFSSVCSSVDDVAHQTNFTLKIDKKFLCFSGRIFFCIYHDKCLNCIDFLWSSLIDGLSGTNR